MGAQRFFPGQRVAVTIARDVQTNSAISDDEDWELATSM